MVTATEQVWAVEFEFPEVQKTAAFLEAIEGIGFSSTYFETENNGPWRACIYMHGMPDAVSLSVAMALASAQSGLPEPDYVCHPLPDIDWVSENQKSFKPIRAGRFFVHPSHYDEKRPAGLISLKIDAATAFGTGEHATTRCCLLMLDEMRCKGRFGNVLDLGCGTGILGMAVAKAGAKSTFATDIDPEAVRVAAINARANGVATRMGFAVAEGMAGRSIASRAPFDLIIANILARPLVKLSHSICKATKPGGAILLSGILNSQETMVLRAYLGQGARLVKRKRIDGWSTLLLKKR